MSPRAHHSLGLFTAAIERKFTGYPRYTLIENSLFGGYFRWLALWPVAWVLRQAKFHIRTTPTALATT